MFTLLKLFTETRKNSKYVIKLHGFCHKNDKKAIRLVYSLHDRPKNNLEMFETSWTNFILILLQILKKQ